VSFDRSRTRRGFARVWLTGGEALVAIAVATGTAAYLLAERPCRIVVETDRRMVGAREEPAAVPEPIV
jgi:hypothetical protein